MRKPLPAYVAELASMIGVEWPINCCILPPQQPVSGIPQTVSNGREKSHTIFMDRQDYTSPRLAPRYSWLVALSRLALGERCGLAFSDSTYENKPADGAFSLLLVSNVWVLDLMHRIIPDVTHDALGRIVTELPESHAQYIQRVPDKHKLARSLDFLHQMAIAERLRRWPYVGEAIQLIRAFLPPQMQKINFEQLGNFLVTLDPLPEIRIFAYIDFEESVQEFCDIVRSPYIVSLSFKAAGDDYAWTFLPRL